MTTPHFPTLTKPFAFFPLPQPENWETLVNEMESGHEETKERWPNPRREFIWRCNLLSGADCDTVMGFLRDRRGPANFFYIDNKHSKIWSPHDAPTTSTSGGGALGLRTYYIVFSFGDGTNESLYSEESTQVVAANNLVTVTMPQFPPGVTQAHIYIGTSSGANKFCGIEGTAGATWTEGYTTVNGDSASGQKVLQVAATTAFTEGEQVTIHPGGAREETKTIDTIQAGVSLTMTANLDETHTAVQADPVTHAVDNGSALPSSNTLEEEVRVRLVNNPLPVFKAPDVYGLTLHLREQF
jgi:hypothetical protein